MLAEEIVTRHQRVIFWNFKDSVKQVCVGVDGKLESHFREGSLEEVSHGKYLLFLEQREILHCDFSDEMFPRLSFVSPK